MPNFISKLHNYISVTSGSFTYQYKIP